MAYTFGKRYYVTDASGRRRQISGMDAFLLKNKAQGRNAPAVQGSTATVRRLLSQKSSAPAGQLAGGGYIPGKAKASWQNAYNKAKAANKARENEIRKKYQQRYSAVMNTLQGMGEQERKNILERGTRREGEAQQSAISRGLSMGTIADSLKRSVQEGTDRNLGNLEESLRRTKLGYESGLRKEEADFIERITDQYPDQRLYAQAFRQYGQGAGISGQGGLGAGAGGFSGQFGVGHAFYAGRDPYTGQLRTTRGLELGAHHYFSNQKAQAAARRAEAKKNKKRKSAYQELLDLVKKGINPQAAKGGKPTGLPKMNSGPAPAPNTGWPGQPSPRPHGHVPLPYRVPLLPDGTVPPPDPFQRAYRPPTRKQSSSARRGGAPLGD